MEENVQEQMQEKNQEKDLKKKLEEKVNEIIMQIVDNGIDSNNLETLGELVDIHKDLANEEYWKVKKEVMKMNYRDYGEYNEVGYGRRGVPGSGRGRRGGYSARGRGGNYRGEDMISEMHESYQDYMEGKEEYNRGNYGAEDATIESLDYMLKSVVNFIQMLEKDADSQEEMKLIKHYTKKISEM